MNKVISTLALATLILGATDISFAQDTKPPAKKPIAANESAKQVTHTQLAHHKTSDRGKVTHTSKVHGRRKTASKHSIRTGQPPAEYGKIVIKPSERTGLATYGNSVSTGTITIKPVGIWAAARDGNLAKVKSELEDDPRVISGKAVGGITPLHYAAVNGHKDVVELLLASNADVNAKDDHGITPLRLARLRGHTDVAKILSQHGGHE